jgi:hypothetical protein
VLLHCANEAMERPSATAFQRGAVPFARVGGDVVGVLQELQQQRVGVVGLAHGGAKMLAG